MEMIRRNVSHMCHACHKIVVTNVRRPCHRRRRWWIRSLGRARSAGKKSATVRLTYYGGIVPERSNFLHLILKELQLQRGHAAYIGEGYMEI